MLMTTPDVSHLLKPARSIVTAYVPMGISGTRYSPDDPVCAIWVKPVEPFETVIIAPGIAAPDESVTVPARVPRSPCPCAIPNMRNAQNAKRLPSDLYVVDFIVIGLRDETDRGNGVFGELATNLSLS